MLSTLCALAANAVVDIEASDNQSARPVVKDIANGQDIRILPDSSKPEGSANVSMKGATVKSIEIAAKQTGYTLAFGATIDNNGSENDFAFKNNSKFQWYLTDQTLI